VQFLCFIRYTFDGLFNESIRFAETGQSISPSPINRVFFSDSFKKVKKPSEFSVQRFELVLL